MKKFTALYLVFSVLALSGNLFAQEKRGAIVEIYKTKLNMEGTPWETPALRGELIAVKENSMLLLDSRGADVAVNINEINVIKIVKKSNSWAGIGSLIGGVLGVFYGLKRAEEEKTSGGWHVTSDEIYILRYGFIFGLGGAILGGIAGAVEGKNKTIQFEGKTDSEIQEILEKLRKKARVPNYL